MTHMYMAGIIVMEVDVSEKSVQENMENDDAQGGDSERSVRIIKLPVTRIKHIMKLDPDVTLASQEAVIYIAKATELFVQDLAKEAYTHTSQGKRKTIQKKDLDLAVDRVDEMAFLEGAL